MDIADALDLLKQHRRLTSRLAGRIGRSEAEDLASEAVTRGLGRPAPDGCQAPWIERIFRNLVIDRGRRVGRVAAKGAHLGHDDLNAATPEDLLLARERRGVVLGAIPKIPFPLRDALMARFFEDHDYEGMAATRGITAATARTRVRRALARLRVSLARLRAVVPIPLAFGPQSVVVALMPAVFSAGLVIPSLVVPGRGAVAGADSHIVLAQSRSATAKRERDPASPTPSVAVPPSIPRTPSVSPASGTPVRRAPTRATVPAADAPAAVQRFNYVDDEVIGDLKRPGIDQLTGDPKLAKHASLIEIPRSFEPAITKMLEDI